MRVVLRHLAILALAAGVSIPALATTGAKLTSVGSASISPDGAAIQLTSGSGSQAGAAWLTDGISTNSNFTATFSFNLQGAGTQADGISFALQAGGNNVVGMGGGYVGYNGLNAVGSVIQTYTNNRLGLNTDGNAYNTKSAGYSLGSYGLVKGTQTVSYNATTHAFTMTGTLDLGGHTYNVSDSTFVDLASKFGSTMYVGFTGATGANSATQSISNFDIAITPVPEPETAALWLVGLAGLAGLQIGRAHV